jgi:ubiquinone/menaquinone biosynthesis C-methylase UbiE
MIWLGAALVVLALGWTLYWALIITEGAYLGPRIVALLYDWTPAYYDRIKASTWQADDDWLIEPLLRRLGPVAHPLVLDVGTGTGRFPLALLQDPCFQGQVWGLDISLGMLQRAHHRLARFQGRSRLILDSADKLPFPDGFFDAVVCLEAIEFTPDPKRTLGELVRVLCPGGALLISNRIGRARWFPGRTYDDDELLELLSSHPLQDAQIHNWNSFYDLVWARKQGQPSPVGRGENNPETWLHDVMQYVDRQGILERQEPLHGRETSHAQSQIPRQEQHEQASNPN